MIRRVASGLLFLGFAAAPVPAQTPPAPPAPAAAPAPNPDEPRPSAANPSANPRLFDPTPTDPAHPNYHAGAHRSIVRHNPLPTRAYSDSADYRSSDSSGTSDRMRNSGYTTAGVGRYAEKYDSRTTATHVDNHPVPVGRFDSGGGPNRAEQLQAEQTGNQRAQTTQNTINTYGRPYGAYGAGFGYGLGLAGGGLYSFPR